MAYAHLLTRLLSEDHLSQKALADVIGIAPATLRRLLNDQVPSALTQSKLEAFLKQRQPQERWVIYLDESFTQRSEQMYVSATLIKSADREMKVFREVVYPNQRSLKKENKAVGNSMIRYA
ncbi:MAG: helix-turn-helix domain-containing protein [Lacticaseibacillus paracasei]